MWQRLPLVRNLSNLQVKTQLDRLAIVALFPCIPAGYGLPTLQDIMAELAKPGRDPRQQFKAIAFATDIGTINRLTPGMKLAGIVTNVTNFGAFVDIGVHQNGLVHISELSDKFVKNPTDVVRVNQKVMVTVLTIDPEGKRISLSMRSDTSSPGHPGADI